MNNMIKTRSKQFHVQVFKLNIHKGEIKEIGKDL